MTDPEPTRRPRTAAALLLAAGLVAATAAPASAHGIDGDAAERSVLGFVPLGFEHMLLGWDHLLFVAGVLLLAQDWRRAAKVITAFVLGHSTTLVLATLVGWRVDAGAVDVAIGLSVVMVGLLGMFAPGFGWGGFTAVVAAFGLLHGLGLATRLQDLGLPEEGVLWRVVAFNVGIELGQLTAILAMVVAAMLFRTLVTTSREELQRKAASTLVFAGGATATAIVAVQTVSPDEVVTTTGSCVAEDRTTTLPASGGHLERSFYGPGETAPLGDFGHSVGDGYVAVLYPADLPDAEVAELRAWVEGEGTRGVLAGPHPDGTDEVQALTARGQLTCESLDVDALSAYTTDWFSSF